jgi:hypothetical protein
MRNRYACLAVLGLSSSMLMLSGCFHSEKGADPGPSPQSVSSAPVASAPASAAVVPAPRAYAPWRFKYVSRCATAPAEKCNGAYGFAVNDEGGYEIGPGPDGQVLSGVIALDERRSLSELVVSTEQAPQTASASCAPAGPAETGLWSGRKGAEKASCEPDLEAAIKRLAFKYYPETFPNPCIDAALALERAYGPLQKCQADSDCAYLDDSYLPLDPRRPGEVTADDCTYVHGLRVANGFEAVSHQLELILKRSLALRVCGQAGGRPGCERASSSSERLMPPICDRGVCRAGN